MDRKEIKKHVKTILKNKAKKIELYDIIVSKYKSDGIDLFWNNINIGRLGYAFVSEKFTEFGAVFGMHVVVSIKDDKISTILKKMNLSYNNYMHSYHYFGFSSLNYYQRKFYKDGTVSFYEKDDLEQKCEDIVLKINELYIPKIKNFIEGNLQAIDDIMEQPTNYGFPMAYSLIICKINGRDDLIEDIIKRGKQKKFYDSSQNKVDEILKKLDLILVK